jgi:hypothetical protein
VDQRTVILVDLKHGEVMFEFLNLYDGDEEAKTCVMQPGRWCVNQNERPKIDLYECDWKQV